MVTPNTKRLCTYCGEPTTTAPATSNRRTQGGPRANPGQFPCPHPSAAIARRLRRCRRAAWPDGEPLYADPVRPRPGGWFFRRKMSAPWPCSKRSTCTRDCPPPIRSAKAWSASSSVWAAHDCGPAAGFTGCRRTGSTCGKRYESVTFEGCCPGGRCPPRLLVKELAPFFFARRRTLSVKLDVIHKANGTYVAKPSMRSHRLREIFLFCPKRA